MANLMMLVAVVALVVAVLLSLYRNYITPPYFVQSHYKAPQSIRFLLEAMQGQVLYEQRMGASQRLTSELVDRLIEAVKAHQGFPRFSFEQRVDAILYLEKLQRRYF